MKGRDREEREKGPEQRGSVGEKGRNRERGKEDRESNGSWYMLMRSSLTICQN